MLIRLQLIGQISSFLNMCQAIHANASKPPICRFLAMHLQWRIGANETTLRAAGIDLRPDSMSNTGGSSRIAQARDGRRGEEDAAAISSGL